jgi:hypothetical protein
MDLHSLINTKVFSTLNHKDFTNKHIHLRHRRYWYDSQGGVSHYILFHTNKREYHRPLYFTYRDCDTQSSSWTLNHSFHSLRARYRCSDAWFLYRRNDWWDKGELHGPLCLTYSDCDTRSSS